MFLLARLVVFLAAHTCEGVALLKVQVTSLSLEATTVSDFESRCRLCPDTKPCDTLRRALRGLVAMFRASVGASAISGVAFAVGTVTGV